MAWYLSSFCCSEPQCAWVFNKVLSTLDITYVRKIYQAFFAQLKMAHAGLGTRLRKVGTSIIYTKSMFDIMQTHLGSTFKVMAGIAANETKCLLVLLCMVLLELGGR